MKAGDALELVSEYSEYFGLDLNLTADTPHRNDVVEPIVLGRWKQIWANL